MVLRASLPDIEESVPLQLTDVEMLKDRIMSLKLLVTRTREETLP